MKKITTFILLILITACGSDNENAQLASSPVPTATVTPVSSTFFLSDGICYDNTTRASVTINFCASGEAQYFSNNGSCLRLPNNTPADSFFCPTLSTNDALTYSLINGQCISNLGQVVDASFCPADNGPFTNTNGICFDSTGQQVDISLCPTTTTTTTDTFTLSNGLCFNSQGLQVDLSFCPASTTEEFTLFNGFCFNSSGQSVDNSFCSDSTGSGTDCSSGIFFFLHFGQLAWVDCGIIDCSGQTLLDNNGQSVTCN